jgi:ribosome-associated heat shock protein Hsp15
MTEVRADVWLWAARLFKTRALSRQAIEGGKLDVNDAGCKPAKLLRAGDRLKLARGQERLEFVVLGLSDRRGPAAEAQQLYRETAASRQARELERERRQLTGASFSHPPGRPDKHARRDLRQLKGSR